ncbi:hypothetical protein BESB_032560 [Besnoitia besnoiti]|uniref:Transmembrane protein n=1 Tax=Besnoitia besnoiti TaxID=94643 RepID=A0A2A9LZ74_BESBE|nr:uncharacterized protein BESB_032560 [Besnoitia besnoiti]PFH31059.1 hypothetical protein BESB_032560 [Besnoitia besnoiti]
MVDDPYSARFCLGRQGGRFCSFPPDEPPALAEQVSGRAIVEETLLQLCLSEYAAGAAAGNNPGSSTSPTEGLQTSGLAAGNRLLWSYLDAWCRDCTGDHLRGGDVGPTEPRSTDDEMDSAGESGGNSTSGENRLFEPFDTNCSLKKLTNLGVPVEDMGRQCEAGNTAENLLQRQIDLHLSRVPVFFINTKEMTGGDLTAEAIVKALCQASTGCGEQGGSTGGPWSPCSDPALMKAPTLSEAKGHRGPGGDGIAVAAHLLKTYGRSPGDPATAHADGGDGAAVSTDEGGLYRLTNSEAIRYLHKYNREVTHKASGATAAAIFEGGTGHPSAEGSQEPVMSLGSFPVSAAKHPHPAAGKRDAVGEESSHVPDQTDGAMGNSTREEAEPAGAGQPEGGELLCIGWGTLVCILLFGFVFFKYLLSGKSSPAERRTQAKNPVSHTPSAGAREKTL